jgi:hypothetical protein
MANRRRGGRVRTQINRGGAPPGNGNAKKALKWSDGFDLSTPLGVASFLQEIIKRTWTGELGTRAASALNGSIRLMFEHVSLPELQKRLEVLERQKELDGGQ